MWYYWPALMRRYIQLYKGQLARKLSISRNILGDKADAGQDFRPLSWLATTGHRGITALRRSPDSGEEYSPAPTRVQFKRLLTIRELCAAGYQWLEKI